MLLKALSTDLSCSDPSLIARSRPNFVTILIAVGVKPPRLSIENGRNSMLSLDTAPPIWHLVDLALMTHSRDSSGVGSVAGEGVKPEAGPDADIDQGIEALRAPAAD